MQDLTWFARKKKEKSKIEMKLFVSVLLAIMCHTPFFGREEPVLLRLDQ